MNGAGSRAASRWTRGRAPREDARPPRRGRARRKLRTRLAAADPSILGIPVVEGTRLAVPRRALAVRVPIAFVCLAASWALIDDATLSGERDPLLVYPAGEALCAALVDVHDDEAGRHRALIESLPRPRGHVVEETSDDGTEWVGVTPVLDLPLPPGWRAGVRIRRTRDDGPGAWLDTSERGGTHWVLRSAIPGRAAGYQVGIVRESDRVVAWGDWAEAVLTK